MLPSFGVVAPDLPRDRPPSLDLPGCDINLAQVVHGSQAITVHAPLPTSASATVRTRISEVWDKGKAAVIGQEGVATSAAGEELWTTRSSIFVRGEGGWGGDRGSSEPVELPDRAPDTDTTYDVTPQQALLYRLCGDRNPLHADPSFARGGGLPRADPARPVLLRDRAARRSPTSSSAATPRGSVASRRGSPAWCSPARRSGCAAGARTARVVASATVAGEGERDGAPVLADVVLTTV